MFAFDNSCGEILEKCRRGETKQIFRGCKRDLKLMRGYKFYCAKCLLNNIIANYKIGVILLKFLYF